MALHITEVKVHEVPMAYSWLSEGLIANPMSIYPNYRKKRSSWFGPMTTAIIEISTDAGVTGLGIVGGGKAKLARTVIEEQLKTLLIGQSPFDIELLWEQMFRASQFYGRKGAVINVISGIDIALWDLLGKILNQPVYNLLGGKTKDKIRAYVTGNLTERHKALGFRDVKLGVQYGPADGREGLRKNIEHIAKTRQLIGSDGDDSLTGLGGDDTLIGGNGIDTAYYGRDEFFGASHGVIVNLSGEGQLGVEMAWMGPNEALTLVASLRMYYQGKD